MESRSFTWNGRDEWIKGAAGVARWHDNCANHQCVNHGQSTLPSSSRRPFGPRSRVTSALVTGCRHVAESSISIPPPSLDPTPGHVCVCVCVRAAALPRVTFAGYRPIIWRDSSVDRWIGDLHTGLWRYWIDLNDAFSFPLLSFSLLLLSFSRRIDEQFFWSIILWNN